MVSYSRHGMNMYHTLMLWDRGKSATGPHPALPFFLSFVLLAIFGSAGQRCRCFYLNTVEGSKSQADEQLMKIIENTVPCCVTIAPFSDNSPGTRSMEKTHTFQFSVWNLLIDTIDAGSLLYGDCLHAHFEKGYFRSLKPLSTELHPPVLCFYVLYPSSK